MEKPFPAPTAETRIFWDGCRRGELLYQACRKCGHVQFYPRRLCIRCLSEEVDWRHSSGNGTIFTVTTVNRPTTAAFKDDVPYVIALVDLDEGFRMMLNVHGDSRLNARIGDRVRIGFEERPRGETVPFAELVSDAGSGTSTIEKAQERTA
jgi:uncharacterized OB-fold protein